jgi:hypothetical protein
MHVCVCVGGGGVKSGKNGHFNNMSYKISLTSILICITTFIDICSTKILDIYLNHKLHNILKNSLNWTLHIVHLQLLIGANRWCLRQTCHSPRQLRHNGTCSMGHSDCQYTIAPQAFKALYTFPHSQHVISYCVAVTFVFIKKHISHTI